MQSGQEKAEPWLFGASKGDVLFSAQVLSRLIQPSLNMKNSDHGRGEDDMHSLFPPPPHLGLFHTYTHKDTASTAEKLACGLLLPHVDHSFEHTQKHTCTPVCLLGHSDTGLSPPFLAYSNLRQALSQLEPSGLRLPPTSHACVYRHSDTWLFPPLLLIQTCRQAHSAIQQEPHEGGPTSPHLPVHRPMTGQLTPLPHHRFLRVGGHSISATDSRKSRENSLVGSGPLRQMEPFTGWALIPQMREGQGQPRRWQNLVRCAKKPHAGQRKSLRQHMPVHIK